MNYCIACGENPVAGHFDLCHDCQHVEEALEWSEAMDHFEEVRERYRKFLGVPGVNVTFALREVFQPLADRFKAGERSQSLFDEMMGVE